MQHHEISYGDRNWKVCKLQREIFWCNVTVNHFNMTCKDFKAKFYKNIYLQYEWLWAT